MNNTVLSQVIESVAWLFVTGTLLTIAVYLVCESVLFLRGDDDA